MSGMRHGCWRCCFWSVVAMLHGLSASAATLFVSAVSTNPTPPFTTWDTATRNLQDAVDAAQPGDTVLVTNGVYGGYSGGLNYAPWRGRAVYGTLTNVVAIDKAIRVQSVNGPQATVIKAVGGWGPSVRCAYVGSGAVLSGFQLYFAYLYPTGDYVHEQSGGGAWCEASAVITNCLFYYNSVPGQGAAVYGGTLRNCSLSRNEADGEGGGAYGSTLVDCSLDGNSANNGGGAAQSSLINCRVISNTASNRGGGTYHGSLQNCAVLGNSAALYGGANYGGALRNCIVKDNSAGAGGGVATSTLTNCLVTGNSAAWYGGGALDSVLELCTVATNSASSSYFGGGVVGGTLRNCIVYYNSCANGANYSGSSLSYSCTTPLAGGLGNITNEPAFVSPSRGDFHLQNGSPCIDAAIALGVTVTNDLDGNLRPKDGNADGTAAFDLGAYEAHAQVPRPSYTLHVWTNSPDPRSPYTNWATAAHSLQEAVDAAQAGDTVLVTNGVYATGSTTGRRFQMASQKNRLFIDRPIMVRSVNGPQATVIEGAPSPAGAIGEGAIRCAYVGFGATLSGFTLTNGYTSGAGNFEESVYGGGVFSEDSTMVTNCIVTGSSAPRGGGAVWGTLDHCVLSNNHATDSGGGADRSTLRGCRVVSNSATWYGGGTYGGTLYNCVLWKNASAWQGGGAHSGTLQNCTVVGNTGNGVERCTLYNCIVYQNTNGNYDGYSRMYFSCTVPLLLGDGNIASDPEFVNAAGGDFRLRSQSPCIDTGTNLNAPFTGDIDGNPRPLDGNDDGVLVFDIGAHEYVFWPSAILHVWADSPNPIPPYTNWATAARTLQAAVDAAQPGDLVRATNGVYAAGGRAMYGTMTNRMVINKRVRVQSVNGPMVTAITGASFAEGGPVRCAYVGGNGVLSGFTLRGGLTQDHGDYDREQSGGAAWCDASGVLTNCVLMDNSASGSGGGAFGGTLRNCVVSQNAAGTGGGTAQSTNVNCLIDENRAAWSGGGADQGSLDNCTVIANSAESFGFGYGGGVFGATVRNSIVYYNDSPNGPNYYDASFGHSCTTPLPETGSGNINTEPAFISLATGDYHLAAASPCIDAGTNLSALLSNDLDDTPRPVDGNADGLAVFDLGAFEYWVRLPRTVYVWTNSPNPSPPYTNWDMAAHVLQDAVDASKAGDTVLVTNGIYAAGGRNVYGLLPNRIAITKPILVTSVNGPAVTMIYGAAPGSGDHAMRCAYVGQNAVLSGFTLKYGLTLTNRDYRREQSGAGVWCEGSGEVVNCVLTNNSANGSGGGAFGGTLRGCFLSGNSALAGGGAAQSSLFNCVLRSNSARGNGGGASASILHHCTVSANSTASSGTGGGVSDSTLFNCIVYFNTSPTGPNYNASTLSYSCAIPIPPGLGNLSADPAFVDAAVGDYHLRDGSPCIDTGTNLSGIVTNDLDGNARPSDGDGNGVSAFDVGAFERRKPGIYVWSDSPNPMPPYVTWVTAARTIQEAVDVAQVAETVLVTNGVYATGGRAVDGTLTNRVAISRAIQVRSVNGPRVTLIKGNPAAGGGLGNGAVRCAYVGGGAVLSGFTLTNGYTFPFSGYGADRLHSGGGVLCEASALVTNCTLVRNAANNGGAATGGTLSHSVLTSNWAAENGGATYWGTIQGCLLISNAVGQFGRGGASFRGTLYNCTVVGNSGGGVGGVDGATIYNCIVYYNEGRNYADYFFCSGNYSCVTPLPGRGTGNITNEPAFVNAASGDFRLRHGSPCIDVGTDLSSIIPSDLYGNLRPLDGDGNGTLIFDIGAVEYNPQTADSNGDSIPDRWCLRYGLNPNDPNLAAGNPDDDPQTTFEEWVADTDPMNALSYFRILSITNGPPVGISFISSTSRQYTLFYRISLGSTNALWTNVPSQTDIPGSNGPNVLRDTNASSPRFYRVGVKVP